MKRPSTVCSQPVAVRFLRQVPDSTVNDLQSPPPALSIEDVGTLLARSFKPRREDFPIPANLTKLLQFRKGGDPVLADAVCLAKTVAPQTALVKCQESLTALKKLWSLVDDRGWDVTTFVGTSNISRAASLRITHVKFLLMNYFVYYLDLTFLRSKRELHIITLLCSCFLRNL